MKNQQGSKTSIDKMQPLIQRWHNAVPLPHCEEKAFTRRFQNENIPPFLIHIPTFLKYIKMPACSVCKVRDTKIENSENEDGRYMISMFNIFQHMDLRVELPEVLAGI